MCAHAIIYYFIKPFNITDYDMSNETIKECLSHQYVMKLHRHTSNENDKIRRNKWPQFVQDNVEHDKIYS